MSQVEAPNYLRKWEFGDSASYAEWPKVADAVTEASYPNMKREVFPKVLHFFQI
jgi:hypothetical protein